MKLRVRPGINRTQLGGDEPPVVQGTEYQDDAWQMQPGSGLLRLQPQAGPMMPLQAGFNRLQPANIPIDAQLPPPRPRFQRTRSALQPMITPKMFKKFQYLEQLPLKEARS